IRVHFEHVRHPLFNDHEYSGDKIVRGTTFAKYRQFVYNCFDILQRPALHAKSLGFVHPSTQEELFFETDIPADMQAIIEKWRIYTANRPE
ncbi:MAG: RNA pseudouridine synthase, partial [Bacteroidota bacterium]